MSPLSLLFVLFLGGCFATAPVPTLAPIPADFLGTFVLARSENLDEYLEASGVSWLVRKMIGLSSITVKLDRLENELYRMEHITSKQHLTWNFALNQTFQGDSFDRSMNEVGFLGEAGVFSSCGCSWAKMASCGRCANGRRANCPMSRSRTVSRAIRC